jgi:hypothetical protein
VQVDKYLRPRAVSSLKQSRLFASPQQRIYRVCLQKLQILCSASRAWFWCPRCEVTQMAWIKRTRPYFQQHGTCLQGYHGVPTARRNFHCHTANTIRSKLGNPRDTSIVAEPQQHKTSTQRYQQLVTRDRHIALGPQIASRLNRIQ